MGHDFVHRELSGLLDGWGLLLVDLIWVNGFPTLTPVNMSLKKMTWWCVRSYF